MITCSNCKWRYPDGLVQPLYTNRGQRNVCGICALAVSNALNGASRTEFTGPIAEQLRLEAIKYREEHPELAPKEAALDC